MALMALDDAASLARKFTQPLLAQRPQHWASNTLAHSHEEALYHFGELALFTLMWRPADFEAGLVERCPVCFEGPKARQAAAFEQATKRECPECFGTTFEGGYRAQIVRPVIISDRSTVVADSRPGTVESDTIQFETTSDFVFSMGDFLTRFDNHRYQMETKAEVIVRTGFDSPETIESLNSMAIAHLEADTTVAYIIPPTDPVEVALLLTSRGPFHEYDIDTLNVEIRPGGYL